MKKCPFRLDAVENVVYCLIVGREVFGPYATESAARKAAGKADIEADIVRAKFIVNIEPAGTYRPSSKATEQRAT